MNILTTVLLLALTGAVVLRFPRYRRQTLWGAVFVWPLLLINLATVGSVDGFGSSFVESAVSTLLITLNSLAVGALAAVVFEAAINHRLSPNVHVLRRHLKWLVIGIVIAIVGVLVGLSLPLSIAVGLLLNALIVLFGWRELVWDVLISATGFALWFATADLVFGFRAAGDISRWLIGPEPLGLTMFGLPLERLVVMAGAGALISPLFSAIKHQRLPHLPLVRHSNTPKILIGVAILLVLISTAVWFDVEYVEPPAVINLSPTVGSIDVVSDSTLLVHFSRPIHRDTLDLIVDPEMTGAWDFADPAIGQHGYRQARFTTETSLLPGVTYRGHITGLRSTWGIASSDVSFQFTTRPLPDIEQVIGTPLIESEGTDIGMMPLDPCQPLIANLSSLADDSSEWAFFFDGDVPVPSAVSADRRNIHLSSVSCFSAGTYRLRAERRVVSRDTVTEEIVAASDWETVYETKVVFGAPDTATDRTMESVNPKVLGVTASGLPELQPVRQQKILKIKLDYQDQPLSCEAAALKMALAAKGVKVSESQIMKRIGFDPTRRRNGIWGDPEVAFVGNINGKQNTTGYGVHWGPIERAADVWRTSTKLTNGTVTDLTKAIDAGHAMVIWGTLGKAYRDPWTTPAGKIIQAWKGEHARTVIGYIGSTDNPTRFVLNDPVAGRLTWTAATLDANWATFNRSGVIVK